MNRSKSDYLQEINLENCQYESIQMIYIDLFCGAGGTSTGIENSRYKGKKCAKVIACVNHDANAIASHASNHPSALHFTEDIRTLELTSLIEHLDNCRIRFPNAFVVLWASLECTNFSKAKGGQPRDVDSRTLADHLFRYIEAIRPDYIQIENVEEFMAWGDMDENGRPISMDKGRLYRRWVERVQYDYRPPYRWSEEERHNELFDTFKKGNLLEKIYEFDYRILNAADFGARTSRKRFFGIFAKQGLPIEFPKQTRAKEAQHTLFGSLKKWKAVKEVLDFTDEGKSIFDRPCPLSPNTLERHKAGLIKFVAGGKEEYLKKRALLKLQTEVSGHIPGVKNIQFLSKYFSGHPESKNISILGPAHTIKTKDNHALISVDFLSSYYGHGNGVRSVEMPCPTVTTKDRFDKVCPKFLISYYSGGGQHSDINNPSPAILANPKQRLVSCRFFDMQYGNSRCVSVEEPAGTITSNPKHSLVTCNRWLMNTNFSNTGSSVQEPAPVITANRKWHYLVSLQYMSKRNCVDSVVPVPGMGERFTTVENYSVKEDEYIPSFVKITSHEVVYEIYEDDLSVVKEIKEIMALYGIIDIKQRMLKISELKRIMGFPEDYTLIGTQADQKKFIGNAVEVNMARVLCEALCMKLKELDVTPLKFMA
ncbi:MAG: DNA cytosine methyltransferase [Odoribacter splanchnicus]